ncbi:MAG: DUF4836 family protein [Raineya sp.]|nr:DUF4836 family protein [Raineya sp.]MDW8295878.1 DUF4836 family protein [Raineya sp.]
MQKCKFTRLAIGLLAVLLIASCKKSSAPEHSKLIPKNAGIVFKVDMKSLTSKTISLQELVSEENLKQMGQDSEEAKKTSKTAKKFLDSGIDLLNSAYVFVTDIDKDNVTGGLTFALDNEEKFLKFLKDEAFWQEVGEKKPEINDKEKIKIATFSNGNKIAWQGKVAILRSEKPSDDDMKKFFSLKDSEQLVSNASFKDALNKNYDILMWIDADQAAKAGTQGDMQATAALSMVADTKDTYMVLGFNFEKGKITASIDYSGNEVMQKMNDQIARNSISNDLVKNIPFAEASTGFSIALNLEGIWKYLQEKGLAGEVDNSLKDIGLSGDLLSKALTGEIFGVTEKVNFDAKLFAQELPVEFVISLGIKDKAAFDEAMNKLNNQAKGSIRKNGDNYEFPQGFGGIAVKKNVAYITLSKSFFEAINKGESKLKGDLVDKATSFASAIYVGKPFFDALVNSKNYKSSAFGEVYGSNFPFESIIFTSDKVKNKKNQTLITITMTDKNKNSLMVLADMAKKADEIRKKEMERFEKEYNVEEGFPESGNMPKIQENEKVLEDK